MKQARDIFRSHGDRENEARCLRNLDWIELSDWKYTDGMDWMRKAIAVYDSTPSIFANSVGPVRAPRHLASLHMELGDDARELELLRTIIAKAQQPPIREREADIFFARLRLGFRLHVRQEFTDEYLALWTKIKNVLQPAIKGERPRVFSQGHDEFSFALAVAILERFDRSSKEEIQQATDIWDKRAQADDLYAIYYRSFWSSIQGDLASAVELADQANTRFWNSKDLLPTNDSLRNAIRCEEWHQSLLREAGDKPALEQSIRNSIQRRDKKLPQHHPQRAYPRQELASLLTQQGKLDEARKLLLAAHDILKGQPATPDSRWNTCVDQLAANYDKLNDPATAERYRRMRRE